jgi:hypothetical protein
MGSTTGSLKRRRAYGCSSCSGDYRTPGVLKSGAPGEYEMPDRERINIDDPLVDGDSAKPKLERRCVYCQRKLKADEAAMCKDCAEKFR